MLDWTTIKTVLLDMDGTLLDLHFDSHFWLEHVPLRYGERHGLTTEEAKAHLMPKYQAIQGTMQWYCIDHWSGELDLDIALLKEEVDHLIAVHPHVPEFLEAVRVTGRRAVLVTNAHSKSLALKMERTQLAGHFDNIICAHDLGLPKEEPEFWQRLQSVEPFENPGTMLVDDSLPVLRSAQQYGIGELFAVSKPDSRSPARDVTEFQAISGFHQIMPG